MPNEMVDATGGPAMPVAAGGRAGALDRVAPPMREAVYHYVQVVRQVIGERVCSLTLFGDVIGSSFDPKAGPAESVLVVDPIEPELLRRFATHGPALGKAGFAAPWVMTPRYLAGSLDAFPLELIEIQQRHATLFGPDSFDGLVLEPGYVRLQCERELKRLLLGLAHGVLASAGKDRAAAPLGHDAAVVLVRTLRGMLWLAGETSALSAVEVVDRIEKAQGRTFQGVRAALLAQSQPGWSGFDGLYRDIEALGEIADVRYAGPTIL